MAKKIIGIDLGTTYSAVAAPEIIDGKGFVVDGITVFVDKFNRKTFPSALALQDGAPITGYRAKHKAAMGNAEDTIMFAKRMMGTDMMYRLGERQFRPQDVSAEVLKFLKGLAEENMGHPVDRAVITVPAYFDEAQQAATREAGELAGLVVESILLEPIAAAYMFLRNYTGKDGSGGREELRIMVYDLGGGTFDVTILEKSHGHLKVLTFGGDPYLGGYDFDKALVDLICRRLAEKNGYRLEFDPGNRQDMVNFTKLLVNVAEPAKTSLSDSFETYIRKTSVELFPDKNGEPVDIDLPLTRADFESLILGQEGDGEREDRKTIQRTIEICRKTMDRANVKAVDEIVLVGGSSYIPMVRQRLREEFGMDPVILDKPKPELAVTIGAALKAGELVGGEEISGLGVSVLLDQRYPMSVGPDDDCVDICGRLEADGEGSFTVSVIRDDRGYQETQVVTSRNGGFLFNSFIRPGDSNVFDLTVTDAGGREVARQTLEIKPGEISGDGGYPAIEANDSYITKPFYIDTEDGLELVAAEATALPYVWEYTLKTPREGRELHLAIIEEDREVGRIVIEGLEGKPAGTPLETTIQFSKEFKVYGRVNIPAPYNICKDVHIDLPYRHVPSLKDLERKYRDLKDKFEEALQANPDANVRLQVGPAGDKIIGGIEGMFRQMVPETGQIDRSLARLDGMIRELERVKVLQPGKDVFDNNIQQARTLLAEALKKQPSLADEKVDKTIDAIKKQGEEAYSKRGATAWQEANKQIEGLIVQLIKIIDPRIEVTPEDLQDYLIRVIRELSEKVEEQGRGKEFEGEIRELLKKVIAVDTSDRRAKSQLRDLFNEFEDLQYRATGQKDQKGPMKPRM